MFGPPPATKHQLPHYVKLKLQTDEIKSVNKITSNVNDQLRSLRDTESRKAAAESLIEELKQAIGELTAGAVAGNEEAVAALLVKERRLQFANQDHLAATESVSAGLNVLIGVVKAEARQLEAVLVPVKERLKSLVTEQIKAIFGSQVGLDNGSREGAELVERSDQLVQFEQFRYAATCYSHHGNESDPVEAANELLKHIAVLLDGYEVKGL